jgi:hypothetical protein
LVITDETPNATPAAPASKTLRVTGRDDCHAARLSAATAKTVASNR